MKKTAKTWMLVLGIIVLLVGFYCVTSADDLAKQAEEKQDVYERYQDVDKGIIIESAYGNPQERKERAEEAAAAANFAQSAGWPLMMVGGLLIIVYTVLRVGDRPQETVVEHRRTRYCPFCGAAADDGHAFCWQCGKHL